MIKEASKSIADMKQIAFFPMVTSVKTVLLFLWFVYIGAYMASVKNFDKAEQKAGAYQLALTGNATDAPVSADDNKTLRYMMMYHLFGLLWTNQIILGIGMTTVAGAVSHWYWDREGFFERKKSAQESICKCSCTKFWTCFCLCGCK